MTATPSDPRPATTYPAATTPAQSSGPATSSGGTGSVPTIPATPSAKALPAGPSSAPASGTAAVTTTDQRPVVNAALKKSGRPAQARAGGGGGAAIAATLALIVAVGAILVAIYALNVARDAKSNAAAAKSFANQAGATPKPVPTNPTANAPATPSPTPAPTVVFQPDLRDVQLTVPPTDGCQSMYVDVDSGQWGNFAGHDFYFSACLGPLTAHLDQVDSAAAITGTVTPDACASKLAESGPTSADLELPVSAGTTLCLLTSKVDAQQAGIPQHLAVVQIRQIASDRTVSLTLDTYKVPA